MPLCQSHRLSPFPRGPIRALISIGLLLFSPAWAASESLPDVDAPPPWKLLGQEDDAESGYALYQRENPGSDIKTFRLEALVDSPTEVVAHAAARNLADPEFRASNTEKVVLRNDEDVIVVYSYIHIDAPFVSDRDVISRIERSYDPDAGTHRLAWHAIDEGPPKKDGVVRLELSEGSWTFSPGSNGTTRAVYTSRADSAGYLPSWIVNAQMSQMMIEGIQGLRESVRRQSAGE